VIGVPERRGGNALRQDRFDNVPLARSRPRVIRLRMMVGARGRDIPSRFEDPERMASRRLPIEVLRDNQAATGNRR